MLHSLSTTSVPGCSGSRSLTFRTLLLRVYRVSMQYKPGHHGDDDGLRSVDGVRRGVTGRGVPAPREATNRIKLGSPVPRHRPLCLMTSSLRILTVSFLTSIVWHNLLHLPTSSLKESKVILNRRRSNACFRSSVSDTDILPRGIASSVGPGVL